MRAYIVAAVFLTPFAINSAVAQSQAAAGEPARGKLSTAETDIGTLLDAPATRAILDKHLPGFSANPQVGMARAMTLKGIQPYAPNITDEVLAAIDADLAALAAKKK